MTTFSYAQLEALWDQAGGPSAQAPIAAAIAEAESGGNPLAAYPGTTVAPGQGSTTDATGLWQILGLPAGNFTAAELTNPQDNAEMAVAKYTQAGNSFTPWQTYDTGAYQQYVQGGIAPNSSGTGGSDTGAATTTASLFPSWMQSILSYLPGGNAANAAAVLADPTNWIDWAERGALMLFGGILIIIGLIRLTSGGSGMSEPSENVTENVTEEAPEVPEKRAAQPMKTVTRSSKDFGAQPAAVGTDLSGGLSTGVGEALAVGA
jgi:hypothetical protein